jgi:hypothetical protein
MYIKITNVGLFAVHKTISKFLKEFKCTWILRKRYLSTHGEKDKRILPLSTITPQIIEHISANFEKNQKKI